MVVDGVRLASTVFSSRSSDGHTSLVGSPSEVGCNALIFKRSRYDQLTDLSVVGMIGSGPLTW